MTYIAIILTILLVLNIYPIFISEDLAFKSKESSLNSQISILATTLSGLENLDEDNVSRVMGLIDVSDVSRCLVTDESGRILYDTREDESTAKYSLLQQVVRALEGYEVFHSEFLDEAIHSSIAMPVTYSGKVIGAVYIYDYDETQAMLLMDFQVTVRTISAVVAVIIIVISILLARGLTRRMNLILAGFKVIRQGEYGYRMKIKGNDELSQLGAEFNNMTDTLEKTEAVRRRFVSDASHELKTPLASIRLLTDSILQTEEMDPELTREFVSDIGHEAERLSRTTEKLLKITRLSAVDDEKLAPVDMKAVAETAVHMLLPLADTAGIKISCSISEKCVMLGVDDDFYQIVFNLVENAVKYNVAGGKVHLRLINDGQHNVMTVDDTGVGIPEADLPKVFDRFYRVDKARSRETGGSGLGLSIVKDTVEKYGGTVSVCASDMGGTRFTVRIPAYRGEVQ